ncbi:MAG: rhomboid family intramembrane serine protease [Bacteroidetes bacterium]|jgi:membrane associated rhomboid family serine protease|nr:rhomboid family intramembrane serine protease [Bacteroidota bacterium]MBU1579478.1 rhomboid family intramembrane serine protease [Bacteroidota bacterium]MBU2464763.1 rhomboid family intramembrane serine protease [Bacteroidota bacterium]MBU2557956.1 rhomboid family intramembrane serine protease [Bacteroidota bacterium]MDA3942457.1 rhomboid family intramembrane serine protease [Bacteroidota bacterium]
MTLAIIILTVLISIAAFNNAELFQRFRFNAWLIKEKKQSWRFFTYAVLHAGWMHLLVNMFVFYSFGRFVEQAFIQVFGMGQGLLYFVLLYVGGVIFSTLYDYNKQKSNPYYDAVGASGAVAAVLFSSILLAPTNSLFIFPIPFPVPAWIFGLLYLVYSAYMGKKGADNIGHNAHFFGAVFGLVFTILINPEFAQMFIVQMFG